jgi:hypothetical protein
MAFERLVKTAVAASSIIMLLVPASIGAVTIHINAIDYTSFNNACGTGIRDVNGALGGLDCPGDWVRYPLTLNAYGTYSVTVRCWGVLNAQYLLHLIVEDFEQNAQVVDIAFTGKGLCGL